LNQPIQPLYATETGTVRFLENVLVKYLIENGSITLDDLDNVECPQEDREQLAQLIGYSLRGFGTLPYVTDETHDVAHAMYYDELSEHEARIRIREEHIKERRRQANAEVHKPNPVYAPLKIVEKDNNATADSIVTRDGYQCLVD
jgi:hypothetical protein